MSDASSSSSVSRGRRRPQNALPVVFVLFIIGTLWYAYVFLHLRPLLWNAATYRQGLWQCAVMQGLTVLLLVSYTRCIITDPGTVPDLSEWSADGPEQVDLPLVREVKLSTGDRRHCKWCGRFKPDRCHHCRVCNQCILKMDHHCHWVANCIGFRNQKYFALVVIYGTIECHFITCTIANTVLGSADMEMAYYDRFALVFAATVSVLMGFALTMFMFFHAWIMLRAMTTLEVSEKTVWGASNYDQGAVLNIASVLGTEPLFWFLPTTPSLGDGIDWPVSAEYKSECLAAAQAKQKEIESECLAADQAKQKLVETLARDSPREPDSEPHPKLERCLAHRLGLRIGLRLR